MRARETTPNQLTGKRAVLAWISEQPGEEFELIRKRLEKAGATVEIATRVSDVEQILDNHRKNNTAPDLIVSHLHFPSIKAVGLIRWVKRRISRDHPNKLVSTVVVTPHLLGADLTQFCIDVDADQMILLEDVKYDIESVAIQALKQSSRPRVQPTIIVNTDRVGLFDELGELLRNHHQQAVEFEENHIANIANVGGVFVSDEGLIDDLGIKPEKLAKCTGLVVLLDSLPGQNDLDIDERIQKWLFQGAIDCLPPESCASEITNRCLSARRNRARVVLEGQLKTNIGKSAFGESNNPFGQLFDGRLVACLIHDQNKEIIIANDSAEKMFGYDRDTLKTMKIGELHPRGMTDARQRDYEDYLKHKKLKFETEFEKADGTRFTAVVFARSVTIPDLPGQSVTLSEIRSLEHSKYIGNTLINLFNADADNIDPDINAAIEEMGMLLDGIEAISVFCKDENSEDDTKVNLRHAWVSGTGSSAIDDENARYSEVPDIIRCFESGKLELDTSSLVDLKHWKEACYQLRNLIGNGRRTGHIAFPLKFNQRVVGIMVVVIDEVMECKGREYEFHHQMITRTGDQVACMLAAAFHRRSESQIARYRFQEDKTHAINSLAEGIAHDYRNLLTAILGHTSALLGIKGLPQGVKKSLLCVEGAAIRGAGLSATIRDLSKPSGKKRAFRLHEKVSEVVHLLRPILDPEINIDLHLEADSDVVFGDSGQAHQVFMNLILNASQAMKTTRPDGTITITSSIRSRPGYNLENGHLIELSIEDQGPGVDDDHLMKIFDPYFSTKDATEKGTGLGLWVVKRILRNHGGKVKVKSTSAGATFITEWPLEVDLECSHSNSEKEVIPGEGRVLLVDDDVLVRDTCAMLLQTIGYEVETACDGVDAYKLYAKIWDQIDIVLLDQKMPRMSGSECLKKLVLINPEVKVILTSGNLIKSIAPDLEDNIVGNLPKPYTIQVLSEVMEQALLDLAT